jgi:hypothetical protein
MATRHTTSRVLAVPVEAARLLSLLEALVGRANLARHRLVLLALMSIRRHLLVERPHRQPRVVAMVTWTRGSFAMATASASARRPLLRSRAWHRN